GPGETWGLGVNEAMASGCAILMSDKAGGAADLVAEGVNGIRFDPGTDIGKCCDWLDRLLNDRGRLRECQQASRERIKNFTYERMTEALLRPGLL
ncbi:MAG TPA: glycosyltransferase, partial [Puia sp.]|nr:glycosyltransferase [Puia sp.]